MKRFTFSLERVLAWRRMLARLERLRWEQMRAELHTIEKQREALENERDKSVQALRAGGAASSEELAALDRFRRHVDAAREKLRHKMLDCDRRIAAQAVVMSTKERDVKVLEHLRERKLAAWTSAWDRETEQLSSEAFLARWHLRAPGD